MHSVRHWILALLLCAGVAPAAAQPPLPRPKPIEVAFAGTRTAVTDARIGKSGEHTRFVLNISDELEFEVFTLADPYRIVIDLPEVAWRLDGAQSAGGAIRGYRYGLFREGRSRMVIDVSGPVAIANKFLLPPEGERRYRLVLDLAPTDREKYLQTAGWPKHSREPPPEPEPPVMPDDGQSRPANAKRIVVIDPGHGGVDPGATGHAGTLEKDVVLALGKSLKDALLRDGRYDIVMTRDSDIFLSLRARVAVARRSKADLFISLHCDSAPNATARGASVYTLSERGSDREADALARSENQSDVIAGVDLTNEPDIVTNILIDLAQRETKNNSARFAQALLPELRHAGRIVAQTHKFAGFVVLKAPDVPSVLIENGYLSNEDEEAAMNSPRWRHEMASGIARGVDRYFALIRHGRTAGGSE